MAKKFFYLTPDPVYMKQSKFGGRHAILFTTLASFYLAYRYKSLNGYNAILQSRQALPEFESYSS